MNQHRLIARARQVMLTIVVATGAWTMDLGAAGAPAYESIFDPNTLLRVDITMKSGDWDVLRGQTRPMSEALAKDRQPDTAESPYTYFRADIKINDFVIKNVGIRKKGFVGSLDRQKPSLKVNFKKFEKGRKIAGLEKLTLNNNKQDPAAIHQALAYGMFRKAGLVASRANHALVTVNGEMLGVYSNVESIDDEFVKRHFGRNIGTLYEGAVTDFVPGWADKFETKLGKKNDFADVRRVISAAEAKDDRLIEELSRVVDLDQFYRFWAMEVLLQHWDGYSGDRNNYFIYRPGDSGRFVFLPWGADHIADRNPFWQFKPPASVYAASTLCRRLYHHPQARQRYRAALRDLLQQTWDEEAMLAEIDRIQGLIGGYLPSDGAAKAALVRVREFIKGRRQAIMPELDGEAPNWDWPLGVPAYVKRAGSASGTFHGMWGTLSGNPFAGSDVRLDLRLGEQGVSKFGMIGATAGESQQPDDRGNAVVRIMAQTGGSPKLMLINFSFLPRVFKRGTHDIDMSGLIGAVVEIEPASGGFKLLGLLQGAVTLNQAGMGDGEAVSGSFDTELLTFGGME